MNIELVESKLVEVLQGIQAASGQECPLIVGQTKPLEDLPEFDSKVWPVAIGMVAAELNITIPDDVNIFRRENSSEAMTVSEIVARIIQISEASPSQAVEAAEQK